MTENLKIDKASTALVIIDLQKGIASRETAPTDSKTIIENTVRLANEFRKNKMPVILVNVAPKPAERLNPPADEVWAGSTNMPADWTEIIEPLKENSSEDIFITKRQWGAFYGTDLELQLRRRGIKTIVLGGIATNYGVESTARNAYEHGYSQIFVEDAMGSMSKEMHDFSINHVLKRIGLVRKTNKIIEALKD